MIKTTKKESRPLEAASNRQPVCWNKDAQAQSLRVELGNGKFFVFPYIHLAFAKLECAENREVFTMSFTTHDIRVTGKNLRDLGVAAQKLSLDWIKEASARYASLASTDAVFIESIEIEELAEVSKEILP